MAPKGEVVCQWHSQSDVPVIPQGSTCERMGGNKTREGVFDKVLTEKLLKDLEL